MEIYSLNGYGIMNILFNKEVDNMYRDQLSRKAWLYHKIVTRLQGIKDFIKSISISQGFIIVKTLSGEIRFRAPLSQDDINDLKKELGVGDTK